MRQNKIQKEADNSRPYQVEELPERYKESNFTFLFYKLWYRILLHEIIIIRFIYYIIPKKCNKQIIFTSRQYIDNDDVLWYIKLSLNIVKHG